MLIERREPRHDADALPADMPPLLRRIYRNRGVTTAEELDLALGRLVDAGRLGGMPAALDLLEEALEQKHRILIVGDFDADGATSSALAMRALRFDYDPSSNSTEIRGVRVHQADSSRLRFPDGTCRRARPRR